jgi:LysM repeat protein
MNTPSPLMPQGALPPKPSSTIYFKILMVLGIHVVVISGLLLQGCKETPKENTNAATTTTAADQTAASSNPAPIPAPPPVDTSATTAALPGAPSNASIGAMPGAPVAQTPASPLPVAPVAATPAPVAPVAATPAVGGHEYIVAHGDTLGAIARKNGISLRALQEANAGLNPRKLQVGQKIEIPAGGAGAAGGSAVAAASATDSGAADSSLYVVKPGDMLFKIAKAHGTRVKAIMELNDLKTTSIRVGQKLKLPSKMATDLPAASSPATQTASVPAPSVPAAATTSGSAN